MDGEDKFRDRGTLQKICGRSGAESLGNIGPVRVHGQKDQLGPWQGFPETPGRFDAVQQRHRNIQQNHVGLQVLRCVQERKSVFYRPRQFKFGIEDSFEAFQNQCVVIGQ